MPTYNELPVEIRHEILFQAISTTVSRGAYEVHRYAREEDAAPNKVLWRTLTRPRPRMVDLMKPLIQVDRQMLLDVFDMHPHIVRSRSQEGDGQHKMMYKEWKIQPKPDPKRDPWPEPDTLEPDPNVPDLSPLPGHSEESVVLRLNCRITKAVDIWNFEIPELEQRQERFARVATLVRRARNGDFPVLRWCGARIYLRGITDHAAREALWRQADQQRQLAGYNFACNIKRRDAFGT